jgi:hypothetical protein
MRESVLEMDPCDKPTDILLHVQYQSLGVTLGNLTTVTHH